jgi:hypothetical protein
MSKPGRSPRSSSSFNKARRESISIDPSIVSIFPRSSMLHQGAEHSADTVTAENNQVFFVREISLALQGAGGSEKRDSEEINGADIYV